MMKVSIDMSKNDETAQNRVFAKVVEEQTTNDGDVTLLCDFESANYDLDNSKKIEELQEKLEIAVKALDKIVNYNSVAEQVDKYYHIVIDVREIGKEALAKIKEIK